MRLEAIMSSLALKLSGFKNHASRLLKEEPLPSNRQGMKAYHLKITINTICIINFR